MVPISRVKMTEIYQFKQIIFMSVTYVRLCAKSWICKNKYEIVLLIISNRGIMYTYGLECNINFCCRWDVIYGGDTGGSDVYSCRAEEKSSIFWR